MTEIAPDMKLRISVELRRKIEDAAKQNGRTMNGEINMRLETSFTEEQGTILQRLDALEAWAKQKDPEFGTDDATENDDDQSASKALLKHAKTLARDN